MEQRAQRGEAEPGSPHTTAELVTGSPKADSGCMTEPKGCRKPAEAMPKEWLAYGGTGRRGRLSVDIDAIELVQGEETGLVLDWISCNKDNSVQDGTSGDEDNSGERNQWR